MMLRRLFLLFVIGFTTVAVNAQHVAYRSFKHYNERVAEFEQLPSVLPTDIVMLGNSLTEFGGDWSARIPVSFNIVNRGIAGDDAGGILHRLIQVCPSHPKAIFFECGTNDLSHGLSAKRVARDVIKTIAAIRRQSPRTKLYVQSVFPINEDFGRWKTLIGKTNEIPKINALLKKYCEQNGIVFLNIFDRLRYSDSNKMREEYCKDGIHLTELGYDVWVDAIRDYILELNQ